jgi:ABC-2 type transport system permease protein
VIAALRRELRFMLGEPALRAWLLIALLLSGAAVAAGLYEVSTQRASLVRLLELDRADREAQIARQTEWGSAGYYAFHLTYDPPSPFAFAALGERDTMPWKHRIRMLALEGQIHESDVGNPELALAGRLDIAFVAAFLLPLLIIVALHDLHARERQAGRHDLLRSMAGRELWTLRAGLRGLALGACVIVPMWVGGAISGASSATLLGASGIVMLQAVFWSALCLACASLGRSAAVTLAMLVGTWWLLAVLVPYGSRAMVERSVPMPDGARIALVQREAVHGAWDLPKATTMTAFTQAYPEWAAHADVTRPFEWKWYYAFQEVGDLKAADLSRRHREGIARRDRLTGRWAWLSPPALVERRLQRLAATDVPAHLRYLDNVRAFHAALRAFHYPKLFLEQPFDAAQASALPTYAPGRATPRPLR